MIITHVSRVSNVHVRPDRKLEANFSPSEISRFRGIGNPQDTGRRNVTGSFLICASSAF